MNLTTAGEATTLSSHTPSSGHSSLINYLNKLEISKYTSKLQDYNYWNVTWQQLDLLMFQDGPAGLSDVMQLIQSKASIPTVVEKCIKFCNTLPVIWVNMDKELDQKLHPT